VHALCGRLAFFDFLIVLLCVADDGDDNWMRSVTITTTRH